jgi:hypothetical protein
MQYYDIGEAKLSIESTSMLKGYNFSKAVLKSRVPCRNYSKTMVHVGFKEEYSNKICVYVTDVCCAR